MLLKIQSSWSICQSDRTYFPLPKIPVNTVEHAAHFANRLGIGSIETATERWREPQQASTPSAGYATIDDSYGEEKAVTRLRAFLNPTEHVL